MNYLDIVMKIKRIRNKIKKKKYIEYFVNVIKLI